MHGFVVYTVIIGTLIGSFLGILASSLSEKKMTRLEFQFSCIVHLIALVDPGIYRMFCETNT